MKIEIIGTKKKSPIGTDALKGIVEKTLNMEKAPKDSRLTINMVSDRLMKQLNKVFMNRPGTTDVLAFSMIEGKRIRGQGNYLGDVVISLDTARKNAKKYKNTLREELCLYVIHGILHLLGYDDTRVANKKKMRKREHDILNAICADKIL
jgi:probable rRNA maturation factor